MYIQYLDWIWFPTETSITFQEEGQSDRTLSDYQVDDKYLPVQQTGRKCTQLISFQNGYSVWSPFCFIGYLNLCSSNTLYFALSLNFPFCFVTAARIAKKCNKRTVVALWCDTVTKVTLHSYTAVWSTCLNHSFIFKSTGVLYNFISFNRHRNSPYNPYSAHLCSQFPLGFGPLSLYAQIWRFFHKQNEAVLPLPQSVQHVSLQVS